MRHFVDIPQRMARWEQTDGMGATRSMEQCPFLHHAGEAPLHTIQSPERSIKRRLPNATLSLPRGAFLGPMCVGGLWHVKHVATHKGPAHPFSQAEPIQDPSGKRLSPHTGSEAARC